MKGAKELYILFNQAHKSNAHSGSFKNINFMKTGRDTVSLCINDIA